MITSTMSATRDVERACAEAAFHSSSKRFDGELKLTATVLSIAHARETSVFVDSDSNKTNFRESDENRTRCGQDVDISLPPAALSRDRKSRLPRQLCAWIVYDETARSLRTGDPPGEHRCVRFFANCGAVMSTR